MIHFLWFKLCHHIIVTLNWATSWQNQQNGMCAQQKLRSAWVSTQSDRVFPVCMKKAWVLTYPLSARRRFWSQLPKLIWVFAGHTVILFCHKARASIKGSLGVIYSQKSSSYFQMLMIGSEDFVIMKHNTTQNWCKLRVYKLFQLTKCLACNPNLIKCP